MTIDMKATGTTDEMTTLFNSAVISVRKYDRISGDELSGEFVLTLRIPEDMNILKENTLEALILIGEKYENDYKGPKEEVNPKLEKLYPADVYIKYSEDLALWELLLVENDEPVDSATSVIGLVNEHDCLK